MGTAERVVVIGGGGHAKVVVATLQAMGYYVCAVYDDDERKWNTDILGVPVAGPTELVMSSGVCAAVIAIGNNAIRRQVAERLESACKWITAVHPRAYVHPSATLGEGTVVLAGAIIQPEAVVGEHCIINTGATIDHDCIIGAFSHVAPGAHLAGGVRVGMGALIGVGSAIIPGISVGSWSVVGAGSVVVKDVPDKSTVVGVPAKRRTVEGNSLE